jgi:hypothetical protein
MELPHRRRPSAGGRRQKDAIGNGLAEGDLRATRNDDVEKVSSLQRADSLTFLHRIRTPSSILALAVDDQCVFAGLQGGKIQVCVYWDCMKLGANRFQLLGLVSGILRARSFRRSARRECLVPLPPSRAQHPAIIRWRQSRQCLKPAFALLANKD